jgi:glycerol-1-phosphatase
VTGLRGCPVPLAESYDVALLDLDGVVYLGQAAVPGAVTAVAEVRRRGMQVAFITNNAARTPDTVATHLRELGIPCRPAEVMTAAQAAAGLLAARLPPRSAVLVAGAEGLQQAVRDRGLVPVPGADDGPAAVVVGYDPEMTYAVLAEAALAIRAGALFVASNLDATIPTPRGPLPGNGSLVALLTTATGVRPLVAGKPERPLATETIRRTGARRPLVVGDRLDTDIALAVTAGLDSLLVLSGVAQPVDLLSAPVDQRPDYLGLDVSELAKPQPSVPVSDWTARCRDSRAEVRDGAIQVFGSGLDGLRAAVQLAWSMADRDSAAPERVDGLDLIDRQPDPARG